jgi:chemotaxis protein CheX
MDVKYINPFITSSVSVLKNMCLVDVTVGKPELMPIIFAADSKVVIIGMTGDVRGQILLGFSKKAALDIASRMMGGMQLDSLDEIAESALAELSNMIMGNTATAMYTNNIKIDITPPVIATGQMKFDFNNVEHIYLPIKAGDNLVDIHIALKRNDSFLKAV